MFGHTVIINEHIRGLLFKNGVFKKLLMPGKYRETDSSIIELLRLDMPVSSDNCSLSKLLEKEEIKKHIGKVYEIKENQLALRYTDGIFSDVLTTGKYAFWNDAGNIELKIFDISDPESAKGVLPETFSQINDCFYTKIDVPKNYVAQLYISNRFVRILESGVYYFWKSACPVNMQMIPVLSTKEDIMGQEILTRDKVTLRVSFICYYAITNYEKFNLDLMSLDEIIHTTVQFALRDYIGNHTIDEILAEKEGVSEFVLSKLREKESLLHVSFSDAGVKDIILPGEIRDIMNTVLIAEKQAQANVISRREEVASTRSLLNTAKLMDENATLYKLKELEYAERIFQHVDNVSLNGNGDLISQLSALLTKK